MRVLLLLFQSGFLLFVFLLWLLWPKLPKLCWIVVVRVGTLVLFLTLGEMLSIFPIEDNVCCGFVIYSFYYVEVCSFYSCFIEGFFLNHNCMLNFVKGFLCMYWDNHIFFIFQFVNMVYWFENIEESLHPWDKAHLVMVYDLFNVCWILIARILLRIFASMFISDIGLKFSFFVVS